MMKTLRSLLCLLALTACCLMTQAQGLQMTIGSKTVTLNDGDQISIQQSEDGVPLVVVEQDGQQRTYLSKSFSFDGAIEAYYQHLLSSITEPVYASSRHNDFGFGSILVQRDAMTADVKRFDNGYNWFSNAYENNLWPAHPDAYIHWFFYPQTIGRCNRLIQALEAIEQRTELQDSYLGQAIAFRAWAYLDWARTYEFLPNDATLGRGAFGENIENMTVPIFTEPFQAEDGTIVNFRCDRPRATRNEMISFIASDLQQAETLLAGKTITDKRVPNAAVVEGLRARLYLWAGDYNMAASSANKAINMSGCTPLTADRMCDITKGFSQIDDTSWLMGAKTPAKNQSGLRNWSSWMSLEGYGYSSVCPLSIPVSLYSQMGDNDIRRQLFYVNGNEAYTNIDNNLATYNSLKFRNPNSEDKLGSDYPLMRVEELMLIRAEAAGYQNLDEGIAQLKEFMQLRDPNYSTDSIRTIEDLRDAIFLQKRIELWGEGQIFFDYKRLDKPVDRTLDVDNWDYQFALRTTTRPAWMNMQISSDAYTYFPGLAGQENPSPVGCYTPRGGIAKTTNEVEVTLTNPLVYELLGIDTPITPSTVKAIPAEHGITLKNPFISEATKSSMLVADSVANVYVEVRGNGCCISRQLTGLYYNEWPLYIESTMNGTVSAGRITFPKNSLKLSYGSEYIIGNTKGQFEIRLSSAPKDEASIYLRGSMFPSQYQWKVKETADQKQINFRFRLQGVDKVYVLPNATKEYSTQMLVDFYLDPTQGIELSADSSAWINLPNKDADHAYIYVVGVRNGVAVANRTLAASSLNSSLFSGGIEDKHMLDPDGKEMVKLALYFRGGVKQGHAALVKASMTDDEVIRAFKQNSIRCLYTPKMTYNNYYTYAFLHYPYEQARYRIAVIGEMEDGSVQLLKYEDEENNPLPLIVNPELNLQASVQTEAPDSTGQVATNVTWSADYQPTKCTVTLNEIVSDSTGTTTRELITQQAKSETVTLHFTPADDAKYTATLRAYAKDGDVLDELTIPVSLEPWKSIGWATFRDDALASLYNATIPVCRAEMEEHTQIPGYYRLKNPYGENYPYNSPGDWDATEDHYLYIHAEDPDYVYIEPQTLGVDWGNGEFILMDYAGYYLMRGYDLESAKAAGYGGKLVNGVITFPKKGMVCGDGYGYYYANTSGLFYIAMPGVVVNE